MQAEHVQPDTDATKLRAEQIHHEQEKVYHMEHENIIKTTRKIIKNMNEKQRFLKAKAHVLDSLNYQHPRFQSESLTTPIQFRICYSIISSQPWHWLLYLLSYVFMYMVIFDSREYYIAKVAVQSTILGLFWIDVVLRKYVKTFDRFGKRMETSFFNIRTIIFILMTADLIIFSTMPGFDDRPVRPFRILRCFIPLLFDTALRRTFFSLASAYTDILVYLVFFAVVVCGFALIGNRSLTFDQAYRDPNPLYTLPVDPYKSDYSDLGRTIFITYVVATYDSYPDNQLIAVQNYEPNYLFFIVFIFLNMFLFSSIPGSLIYNKFRETHSKLILMDQIRQQHSLIIAFVTLANNDMNLDFNVLIKFLNYLYRYKIRYVEFITEICLKIDDNHNKTIQVNEFMQLSQIILENRAMIPPRFDDIQAWVNFRTFCKERLHLKAIVNHWLFQSIVSVIILLSFINSLYFSFNYTELVNTFDTIFIWLFVVQLTLRIVAIGPENFFADRWNNLDTFLVVLGVAFFFLPVSNNAGSIARIGRIFRVASLLRIISHSNFLKKKDVRFIFLQKLKMIFQVLLEIMPIILRFLPLFLFVFYIFSIIGMQLFYNSYASEGSPDYRQYDQFSSFRNFIEAHYIMVQILTEAGWSMIAYDHCWRNPQYYAYVMIYFCFMHIIIVYIIATLIKGIFWEVYFTVDQIFREKERETLEEQMKEQENEERTKEIKFINEMIKQEQTINPDTILKRELYENNLDQKIFKRLKKDQERQELLKRLGGSHPSKVGHVYGLVSHFQIPIDQMQASGRITSQLKKLNSMELSLSHDIDESSSRSNKIDLEEIQEYSEEDFESEIDDLFHQVILDPKVKYSHVVGSSKTFNQFLNSKFVRPSSLIKDNEFDLNFHPLYNDQAMQTHIYEIHTMLNIENSKREQKAAIIRDLYESEIIDRDTVERLIRRKLFDKVFNIDTYGTLRRLFLSETNEHLIRNFQVEYFSHLYGHSFKQINKMTLGPLLKVQSTLTYSLRNILRYPQIDNTQFFEMMTHIEDQYSNKVLKRGSLFKFIYKLDGDNIWFSVEFKRQQEMKVHFIKTGVWCYSKDMEENQVYYSRDAFKWDLDGREDRKTCEKFMKRLYESFEGLAFSLLDQNKFFESNPRKYIYDLYVQCFDAQKIRRFQTRQHEISKVMVVILSKEEKRQELGEPDLPYELSDLIVKEENEGHEFKFRFDDSESDIYEKLKNLTATDHQKIVNSQGLPFSYTVNLMQQLSDTFRSYGDNFVYHIEKVYNDQFTLMTKKHHETSEHRSHGRSQRGERIEKEQIGPNEVSIKLL